MGILDIQVDRIEVKNVPKFVLFGGSNREESEAEGGSITPASGRSFPVSASQIVAVSLVATVLALVVAKVTRELKSKLHC